MLPFTKSPARGDDHEVVTKDDLVKPSASTPATSSSMASSQHRSVASPRPPQESIGEDEMTNIMESRSVAVAMTGALLPPSNSPIPAAGRAAPGSQAARARSGSVRTATSSARGVAPKIVKRTKAKSGGFGTMPTSISPAAVIKATLESARADRRDNLMPGPPREWLDDLDDLAGNSYQSPRSQPPSQSFLPPMHSSAPLGAPSEGMPVSFGPNGYGPAPSASISVSGVVIPASMPAHFVTPQVPASDLPGMPITSAPTLGRPATSWVAVLLACGLLVGAAAFVLVQGRDSFADMTASFIDPSHAPSKARPTPPSTVAAVQPAALSLPAVALPSEPAVTPVVNPVVPPAEPPVTTAVAAPTPAAEPRAPVATTAPATHNVTQNATAKAAPAAPVKAVASARPAAVVAAPPKPAPKAAAVASDDEGSKKTSKGRASKGDVSDDETRKAIEALQKAQLESASSFGKE